MGRRKPPRRPGRPGQSGPSGRPPGGDVPEPPPGGWQLPPEPKIDSIWATTDVQEDGGYMGAIHVGEDLSFVLPPDRVVPYAAQVFAAAAQADHDAAVMRQLHEKLDVPLEMAAKVVMNDLRPDRPPTNHPATHPLEFYAGVSMNPLTGALHGHVVISWQGQQEELGRWRVSEARQHASQVLEVAAGVELDNGYYRALRALFYLEEARARAVVADLAQFHEPWLVSGGDG